MSDPALLRALQRHFGFPAFRQGQADVIEHVLAGRDCLAVMPTGGGKSLCYQLPALLRPSVTLVVSPLIALMKDQVDALQALGLPATFINSSLAPGEQQERLRGIAAGRYRLVYAAPERFRSPRFLQALGRVAVWLFAVDEAHCVSMWGHDFRPDYLQLARARRALGEPQVLALTATATPEVREDIAHQLALGGAPEREPAVVVRGFARPGLDLSVTPVTGRADKVARLLSLCETQATGIVYCATRRNVEDVATDLAARGIRCAPYHAGLPDEVRRDVQERFVSGALDWVAATNAFGMGIDRADVRAIVHWDVPGSLEAYYQEAGRAGRDGEPARCELLFNHADVRTQEFFLQGANPSLDLIVGLRQRVQRAGPQGIAKETLREAAAGARRGNDMAVSTALGLLERWGAIRRQEQDEQRLVPGPHPEAPDEAARRALADKARRDRARLQRLLRYVRSEGCRHATILRYFGDPEAEGVCGSHCDRCRARAPDARLGHRPPTAEEAALIHRALTAVASLRGRFGQARVAQVLAGSRDRLLRRARLDTLACYGSLRGTPQPRLRQLLTTLQEVGCLKTEGTDYPTIRLTDHGAAVLRGEAEVRLPPAPGASTPGSEPARPGRERVQRSAAGAGDTPLSAAAQTRFETLRAWRLEQARAQGVPAYRVFPDATLRRIARENPRTEAELLAVKGVGPARLRDYGQAVLRLIG